MPSFPVSLLSENSLISLPNGYFNSSEPTGVELTAHSCFLRSSTTNTTSFRAQVNLSSPSNLNLNIGLHWCPIVRLPASVYLVPSNDCQLPPYSDQPSGHECTFTSPLTSRLSSVGYSPLSFSLTSHTVSESQDLVVCVTSRSPPNEFSSTDSYLSPSAITCLSGGIDPSVAPKPYLCRGFQCSTLPVSEAHVPTTNQQEVSPFHIHSGNAVHLESSVVTLPSTCISNPFLSHRCHFALGAHTHCTEVRPTLTTIPPLTSPLSCVRDSVAVAPHHMDPLADSSLKDTTTLISELSHCQIVDQSLSDDHTQQEFVEVGSSMNAGGFVHELPHSMSTSENSPFLQSSLSDIPLTYLEELLARTSVDDVYLGPSKDKNGNLIPLDPSVRAVNECLSLPYSSTSLAYSPPGVMVVTEMWSFFATERLSLCNNRIYNMNMEALRTCLYEHGLNQLGSLTILRRRLQEFVRRVRAAQSSADFPLTRLSPTSVSSSSLSTLHTDSGVSDEYANSPLGQTATPFSGHSLKMVRLPRPVILTPDAFYSYLLIIDLEATCDFQDRKQPSPEYPHEIIEFPVLLYKTRTRRCVGVFHAYCKPTHHPALSAFCTNLTQISQHQVDNAHLFPQVLAKIENWLFKKHRLSHLRCAVVCDCSADMGKFMRIQCRLDKIALPSWVKVWINLSKAFRVFYKLPPRHRVTLNTMLQDLNLMFHGQQHRGLDDAINILRVVRTLLADGCQLRVNERVDFGHPPNYVSSVPRLVAENTSGLMGSQLPLLSRKSRPSGKSSGHEDSDGRNLNSDLTEDDAQSLLRLADIQRSRTRKDI